MKFREKVNCSRCHRQLGFSKNDPHPSWGYDGKLCDDCNNYIKKGIAVYNVEYLEGHSELPTRFEGLLWIFLFDHHYRIIFEAKSGDFKREITSDELLGYYTVVLEETSTARKILTVGLSDSKSEECLKIEFKDASSGKIESFILDIDYPLDTVQKNLEPILVTANNKRKESQKILNESDILNCKKCNSNNSASSRFCSSCGESLQILQDNQEMTLPYQGRDYVVSRGEKTQEEINAEKYAKRLKKPDYVFEVKYLGGTQSISYQEGKRRTYQHFH